MTLIRTLKALTRPLMTLTIVGSFLLSNAAFATEPTAKDKKGKVVAEVHKGYLLNDKIIRFAKVVVGK